MNAPQTSVAATDAETEMQRVLEAQRQDYIAEGPVSAATRKDRLNRGIDIILKYQDKVVEALNTDFSGRSREVTMLTDVAASIGPMKHSLKHLDKWMRGQRRATMFPRATTTCRLARVCAPRPGSIFSVVC